MTASSAAVTTGRRTGERAYIGSFTSAGGSGITVAAVDPATGALTELSRTTAVPDPSFLLLSPDADLLYAVSERPEGGAAALSLRDPDAPAPLGKPVPVHGGAPTHLCLADGHLLTANYASGTISVLPIGPRGVLSEPRDVVRAEGRGPHPERQRGPHAHAVLPDPSGRWIVTVDLGTDMLCVYALDPTGGTLCEHARTALRAGSGPRHLAFHPRGHRAYAVNELEPSLTTLAWDAVEGRFTPRETVLTVHERETDRPAYPSEVVIAPDGRFAWVANRGHDSIAVLHLDEQGDPVELSGTVPCGGNWPRHLTLGPHGLRLYAANERSGDVTWFDVDEETGVPLLDGSLRTPAPSCVVFA